MESPERGTKNASMDSSKLPPRRIWNLKIKSYQIDCGLNLRQYHDEYEISHDPVSDVVEIEKESDERGHHHRQWLKCPRVYKMHPSIFGQKKFVMTPQPEPIGMPMPLTLPGLHV